MSIFAENFKDMATVTHTENGAKAFTTTGSVLLDLFANIGGMRGRVEDAIDLWKAARIENKELADNLVLYTRNIRDCGLGERKLGRALLRELAILEPEKVIRNFVTIAYSGRWDDLYTFIGIPKVEDAMWSYMKEQFKKDVDGIAKNEPISLLMKWMKSINTSSEESRRIARLTCKKFGITERTYRKTLAAGRRHINVVECLMSAGRWDEINFESVPSVAMNRYINTYNKHCQERFAEYKMKLAAGEAKVNATTLYPYDICMKYFNRTLDEVDEAQWKALPNYVNEDYEVVIMADVSGSMMTNNCQPMATSIGLATYFAQRNKGAYHNMYMTFTSNPHFITINDGMPLGRIFAKVRNEGVGYSTNLDAAFKAIFEVALRSGECPRALVVISDCEIDRWMYYENGPCASIAEKWERIYKSSGLVAPKLILWNVESRGGRVLAKKHENVAFISGYGIGSFGNLTELIENDAYTAMVKILSKPQFQWM